MRIVVSDTTCMIDLRKVALLEAFLRLPYTVVMPDTLFDDEWLSLSDDEKETLRDLGLEVRSLSGELVQCAGAYFNQHVRLKLNDCFALTLAEDIADCILLTGDRSLRRVAEDKGIEVHGVLWVMDELEAHNIESPDVLRAALQLFRDDDLVFLPPDEIARRMRQLTRVL